MTHSQPTIATPDGEMPAHLWLPEAGTGPGLVLLQEIFGISRYVESRAQDLADLGYVVLAPELYWRLGEASVPDGPEALDTAMALAGRLDWEAAVRDSRAALDALRQRPEVTGGVGVLGFCLGGGLAFNVAALGSPDVLVSYYGSSVPELLDLAPLVTAPSLHHYGLADSYIPRETVEHVRSVLGDGADVTFEVYEGADHAFDNPDFPLHHPDASARAWDRTAAFLAQRLPAA